MVLDRSFNKVHAKPPDQHRKSRHDLLSLHTFPLNSLIIMNVWSKPYFIKGSGDDLENCTKCIGESFHLDFVSCKTYHYLETQRGQRDIFLMSVHI